MTVRSACWTPRGRRLAAVAALAAALVARLAIDPWLDDALPFVTLYAAVGFAAWVAGALVAALLASVGYLAADALFVPPRGAVGWSHLPWAAAYGATCALLVALAVSVRRGARQRREIGSVLEAVRAQLRGANDELGARDSRLQFIMDAAPMLISYVDAGLRYRHNNSAYEAWFGRTPGELVGKTMREVLGEAAWQELRPHAEAALRGEHVRYEGRVPYRDGGPRWIRAAYVPDLDARGHARGFVALVLDVTAQREAELARGELQSRFEAFMEHAPVRVYLKDEEGRYVFANRALLDAVGLPAPEVLGRTDEELFPVGADRGSRERDRNAAAEGRAIQFREAHFERGVERQFLSVRFPVKDAHARTLVGGFSVDVTDRVRAEQALRESEEKFRRIVETANEGIWLLDENACVTFANQRMLDLLGYRMEDMLGRPKWDFLVGRDRERVLAMFERRRAGVSEQLDVCFEHSDGRPVWMIMAARPIFDEDGAFRGTLDMFTDVTERKLLEAELEARLADLAEADRRKDEFIATLSHELRNPLAPIRNAVALLRELPPSDPRVAEVGALLERQVVQLTRLTDDLLDASRITRGRLELRRERVQLADVVQSALETSRAAIEEGGQTLEVALPPEPVHLDADGTRLAQVFTNLLNNAAKYTPPGGRIAIEAVRGERTVEVRVRDTGIGIEAEQVSRLFEPFWQAATALDRSGGGLGIGLALVRGLVELHGGTVEVRSEGPGRGSEFTVRLPLAGAPGGKALVPIERADAQRGRAPRRRAARPRRVLVVDDNLDAAESLALLLRLRGHEVREAHDGAAAVEAAAAFRPDAVLLDIGLPGLNGYEAARRMREEPWSREAVFVAVTGWGQDADKRRSREAGIDHHLTKPVDVARLDELIEVGPGRAGDPPAAG